MRPWSKYELFSTSLHRDGTSIFISSFSVLTPRLHVIYCYCQSTRRLNAMWQKDEKSFNGYLTIFYNIIKKEQRNKTSNAS